MSTEQPLKRDERTVAVENAAYKWGFRTLFCGVLVVCLYRSKVRNEDIGDLLLVGCISVAVVSVYLFRHKAAVIYWPWNWRKTVGVLVISFIALFLMSILFIVFFQ